MPSPIRDAIVLYEAAADFVEAIAPVVGDETFDRAANLALDAMLAVTRMPIETYDDGLVMISFMLGKGIADEPVFMTALQTARPH